MTEYPDFIKTTGYRDVAGLCGANCRHNFRPFYPGITTPSYTTERLEEIKNAIVTYRDPDTGEEKEIPMVESQEHHRYLERGVRIWKQVLYRKHGNK